MTRADGKEPRAALYVRVSALMDREIGSDRFLSPDIQLGVMRNFVATENLRETAVHTDIDVTGTSFNRRGLDQVRAMAERGEIEVLVVHDLSRLGRNTGEALTLIQWLRERGVRLRSAHERIDDSPEGQLMLTQFLGIAEYGAHNTGRGWQRAIAALRAQGRYHGHPPFGYRRRPDGFLIPDPATAPLAQEAFRRYAAGDSVSTITRMIVDAGHAVDRRRVRNLLRNPAFVGRVRIGVWEGPARRRRKTGTTVIPAGHEALVDPLTWERVQRRLAENAKVPNRSREPTHSLAQLVRCVVCENLMVINKCARTGLPRLRCATRRGLGPDCPGVGSPLVHLLEEEVLKKVLDYTRKLNSNHQQLLAERRAAAQKTQAAAEDAAARLDETQERMRRLTRGWTAGTIADWLYEEQIAELEKQRLELLARVNHGLDPVDSPTPAELVAMAEALREAWPLATPPERNRLLRTVVKVVWLSRARRKPRQPLGELVRLEIV